jgi:hypothetical protein
LGYFIGKSKHLKNLFLHSLVPSGDIRIESLYEAFFFGVNNNKSINRIEFRGTDLLGGKIFTMMEPFFKNNSNLTNIEIMHCNFGAGVSRALALALGSITSKSLTKVRLQSNVISEED